MEITLNTIDNKIVNKTFTKFEDMISYLKEYLKEDGITDDKNISDAEN